MNNKQMREELTVSEEIKKRFEEAEKNLERIEKKIKPFIKEKPSILTSSSGKWEDASDLSFRL